MTGNVLGAPEGASLPTWSSRTAREADNETLCSEVESGRIGAVRCWGGS